ncbi:MAG: hypothetical protein WC812_01325 [Candidatus Pacearchaeota archaeon]|jgi:hypothetical protein
MRYLDKIFNKFETEHGKIEASQRERLLEIETKYSNEITALQKEIIKKKKNKEKDTGKINSEYQGKFSNLKKDYYSTSSEALLVDLQDDEQSMSRRCYYQDFPKENIQNALEIKKTLSRIDDESKRILIDNLKDEIKELVQNSELEDTSQEKEIFSYVFNHGNKCYILTPITEDSKKNNLANLLGNKFIDMITKGKKVSPEKDKTITMKETDFNYARGYLIFEIESEDSSYLAKALIERLNNEKFTPEEMRKCNLIHKARSLDYNILKEFEITNIQLNEKTPKSNKRRNKYNLADIYEKIENLRTKYGNDLSMSEIKRELGSKFYFKIDNLRRNGNVELLKIKAGKTGRKKFIQ